MSATAAPAPRRALGTTVAIALPLAVGWIAAAVLLWQSSVVPDDLRLPHVDPHRYFSPHVLDKTEDFSRFFRIDFILSQLVLLVVLAVYAARGERFTRESAAGRIGTGMLLGMLGLGLAWLSQLPFRFAELWWERRYGLSHQGYFEAIFGNWLELGAEFLSICLALLIVMALAGWLGDRWWILGAPAFVALGLLFAFVTPYLVTDTKPLRNKAVAADVRRLARAEGVEDVPVRVEDVSDETTAPNAMATGLGPSRRVFLWSTILDKRFTRGEVRVVVAHEFGHQARNHIWKGIAWYALFAVPGAFLLAMLTRRKGGMADPRAVPLSLLVLTVLQLLALPLQSAISRRIEAEADWVALRTTRDPGAARALFRHFATEAYDQPDPPTWSYLLLTDHPTIEQRIAMANAWQRRAGGR